MADIYVKELTVRIKDNAKLWFGIEHVRHAAERHMDKSMEDLRSRNLEQASSFYDLSRTDLWKLATDMIEEHAEFVAEWMSDATDTANFGLFLDPDDVPKHITGKVLINGTDLIETDSVILVLRKYGYKFRIATIYPFHSKHEPEILEEY